MAAAMPEPEEGQVTADTAESPAPFPGHEAPRPVEPRDDDGPSGAPLVPHEDAPPESIPTDSEESGSEAPTEVLERLGLLSNYRARIAEPRDRRWRATP